MNYNVDSDCPTDLPGDPTSPHEAGIYYIWF